MINPAADNYGMILSSNQKAPNAKIKATGDIADFKRQQKDPGVTFNMVSSAADNYQRITFDNQDTPNQYTIAPPSRGPVGVDSGLHPAPYQYNIFGNVRK